MIRRFVRLAKNGQSVGAMVLLAAVAASLSAQAADLDTDFGDGAVHRKAAPHRNVFRIEGEREDPIDRSIWALAEGAFNTSVLELRRRDYYRQSYFYGGTPYNGRQFYGAPVYYGGPYYTYYRLQDEKPR